MSSGRSASRKFIIACSVVILAFVVVAYGMIEIAEGSGPNEGKSVTDAGHLAGIVNKALEVVLYMSLGYVAGNVLEKFTALKNLLNKTSDTPG